jgi:hypothetical protein
MSVRRRSGFVVPLVFAGSAAISIVLLACLSTSDPAPEGAETSPPPVQVPDVFPTFETSEDVGESLGDGPEGGPLFEAGNMGKCSGFVAKSIPASACGTCEGAGAYALCDGLLYSTCSCDLPPGYVLVDAGADNDGATDAPPQDAAPEVTTTLEGASETSD